MRVVLQCQKLRRLSAADEEALAAQYPKPQLMLPKGRVGAKGSPPPPPLSPAVGCGSLAAGCACSVCGPCAAPPADPGGAAGQ